MFAVSRYFWVIPDTATENNWYSFEVHQRGREVSASMINGTALALRFFVGLTLNRLDLGFGRVELRRSHKLRDPQRSCIFDG